MIKIINETGLTRDTRVIDDNGNDITKYVKSITLKFLPGRVTADIDFIKVSVEVLSDLGILSIEKKVVNNENRN